MADIIVVDRGERLPVEDRLADGGIRHDRHTLSVGSTRQGWTPRDRTRDDDLRSLSDWQRSHLPHIHTALGQQTLGWLIRNKSQPRSFNELVGATTFSTTSVRHLLNQFIVLGLVEARKNLVTLRRGEIVATPKLKQQLEEYAERIKVVLSQARADGARQAGRSDLAGLVNL
jgi:hypothetical protein